MLFLRLTWAETRHVSPFGEIAVHWELKHEVFKMNITVPEGTTAEAVLPDGRTRTFGCGQYQLSCTFAGY